MRKVFSLYLLGCGFGVLPMAAQADFFQTLINKQWQPEHSYYGKTSWEFCNLTIGENELHFNSDGGVTLPYSLVSATNDMAIIEVEASETRCFNPRVAGKTYWRLDTLSYRSCRAWKAKSDQCPKPFRSHDTRKFEISMFQTLLNAQQYSVEPLGFHGYYEFEL